VLTQPSHHSLRLAQAALEAAVGAEAAEAAAEAREMKGRCEALEAELVTVKEAAEIEGAAATAAAEAAATAKTLRAHCKATEAEVTRLTKLVKELEGGLEQVLQESKAERVEKDATVTAMMQASMEAMQTELASLQAGAGAKALAAEHELRVELAEATALLQRRGEAAPPTATTQETSLPAAEAERAAAAQELQNAREQVEAKQREVGIFQPRPHSAFQSHSIRHFRRPRHWIWAREPSLFLSIGSPLSFPWTWALSPASLVEPDVLRVWCVAAPTERVHALLQVNALPASAGKKGKKSKAALPDELRAQLRVQLEAATERERVAAVALDAAAATQAASGSTVDAAQLNELALQLESTKREKTELISQVDQERAAAAQRLKEETKKVEEAQADLKKLMRTKLPALQAERDKLHKELEQAKQMVVEMDASTQGASSRRELDAAVKAKKELERLRDQAVKAAERAAEKADKSIATLRDEKKALTLENHKLAKEADRAKSEVVSLRDLRMGKTTSAKVVEKQAAQKEAALLKEAEALNLEHQRQVEALEAAMAAAVAAAAGQVAAQGDVVSETSAALGSVQSKLRAAESAMFSLQRADSNKAKRMAALQSQVGARFMCTPPPVQKCSEFRGSSTYVSVSDSDDGFDDFPDVDGWGFGST
jgi:hypothetical protein